MNELCQFENCRSIVLNEVQEALGCVQEMEVDTLISMILGAEKVFVVGVGRVLMMMQAFAKRLNHLGISTFYVGEVNEPAITEHDLLIVGSGSGESVIPLRIMQIAKRFDAKVAHIGSNPTSTMTSLEDAFVRIPCRTKLHLEDELDSSQPMSALFEQSLLLLCDTISLMLIYKKGINDISDLWRFHANLE